MKIFIFWIEENSRWIYVTDAKLAEKIRQHYIKLEGYVEYLALVDDNMVITGTDYDNSLIGTKFSGEIDTENTLKLD